MEVRCSYSSSSPAPNEDPQAGLAPKLRQDTWTWIIDTQKNDAKCSHMHKSLMAPPNGETVSAAILLLVSTNFGDIWWDPSPGPFCGSTGVDLRGRHRRAPGGGCGGSL